MPPPPPGGPSPYGYPGPPPPPPAGYPAQSGPHYGAPPPNGHSGPGTWIPPTPGTPFIPTGVQHNKWKRPLIALVPLALLFGGGFTLAALDDTPPTKYAEDAEVGDCMENRGDSKDPVFVVVDCGSQKASVRVVYEPDGTSECPDVYDTYEEWRGSIVTLRLCLSDVKHGSKSTHGA